MTEACWHSMSYKQTDKQTVSLTGDFGLLWFHQRSHHRHDVLTSLGSRVRHVKVMQCHVLHYLLLLVNVAFGQRHVLLGLQVKLGGVRITPTLSLNAERK